MSAFELEEFFARQDDNKGDKNRPRSAKDPSKPGSAATLKKKSKKKLSKSYHSTPDIQAELQAELERQAKENAAKKVATSNRANSQEDVRPVVYTAAETLTLKNGKIVTDKGDRPAAPNQPPPPLPNGDHKGDLIVKVDVNGPMTKSDYANYAQLAAASAANKQMTSSTLSSFRPPEPNQTANNAPTAPTTTASSTSTTTTTTATDTKALRPVKGNLKSSNASSSVYARQETIESLDGDELPGPQPAKPFIPEPDYSSDEETASIGAKRDLSTFRAPPGEQAKRDHSTSSQQVVRYELITSRPRFNLNLSIHAAHPQQVKSDVNGVANGLKRSSIDSTNSSGSTSTPSTAKEAAKLGERRSSEESSTSSGQILPPPPNFPPPAPINNDGVNKVKATIRELERRTSLSSNDSVPGVSLTLRPQKKPLVESNANAANIRMSKSCFEGDFDDIRTNQETETQNQMSAEVQRAQTLNRRNVSERIANLMAQGHSAPQASTIVSAQQQLAASKTAPTTAKTWSEISSAIRAAKGPPMSAITSATATASTARPVSAPSARQMAAKDKAIKLHVAAAGAPANEVDVMAELVPPPPEFAAPPPLAGHVTRQTGPSQQQRMQLQVKAQSGLVSVRQASPQPQPQPPPMPQVSKGPEGTIRILTPAQPMSHVIHKPKATAAGNLIEQQQMEGRKTATPPLGQETYTDMSRMSAMNAGHSHIVTSSGHQVVAISAAQYNSMSPQQQAQYQAYVQHAAKQQQFATLGRAYQGQQAKQQQQMPISYQVRLITIYGRVVA